MLAFPHEMGDSVLAAIFGRPRVLCWSRGTNPGARRGPHPRRMRRGPATRSRCAFAQRVRRRSGPAHRPLVASYRLRHS